MTTHGSTEKLAPGTVLLDRFELQRLLRVTAFGEDWLAYDRSGDRPVLLDVPREGVYTSEEIASLPGWLDTDWRVSPGSGCYSHPSLRNLLEVVAIARGFVAVWEWIDGPTLREALSERAARGGCTLDELRRIASTLAAGLAAIHVRLITTDSALSLDEVTLDEARGAVICWWRPQWLVVRSRNPSPPMGTAEDDVLVLGRMLWEAWSARPLAPGEDPRSKPLQEQMAADRSRILAAYEMAQIFRCLHSTPRMRPLPWRMRFDDTAGRSDAPIWHAAIDSGPPPWRGSTERFIPRAQALLVVHAPRTPALVGELFSLAQEEITLGRRGDSALVLDDPTIADAHATLRWQQGAWRFEDQGSRLGSYTDDSYEPQRALVIRHGEEAQLGECRLKLVSFPTGSPHHMRARTFLAERDGLTHLCVGEALREAMEEEQRFAAWADLPAYVVLLALVGDASSVVEMLALRRVARRFVFRIEEILGRRVALVAGRIGPRAIIVSIVGHRAEEVRHAVDNASGEARELLPEALGLEVSVSGTAAHPGALGPGSSTLVASSVADVIGAFAVWGSTAGTS